MIAYCIRLFRRFREERFAQLSGSLSFTTLLSIVPMVAVTLAISRTVPFLGGLVGQMDNFFLDYLLPEQTGNVVAQYAYQFSRQAGRLTAAGAVMLVATSFVLMMSIERAFNHLWRVRQPRPWLRRAVLYSAALLCGPLIAAVLLAVTGHIVSVAVGLAPPSAWANQKLAGQISAGLLLCAFFTVLYAIVPATRVRLEHALLGGVVATLGIFAAQRAFSFAVGQASLYKTLYGGFATLPIFLLWIYLCWAIVLVGALVAANFMAPDPAQRRAARKA